MMRIISIMALTAFLAASGALPRGAGVVRAEDVCARAEREIKDLEDKLKVKGEELADKERALERNLRDQESAQDNDLGRLKAEGVKLGQELNRLQEDVRALDLSIDGVFSGLRESSRKACGKALDDASKALREDKDEEGDEALESAGKSVELWKRGIERWRGYEHIQEPLRQPATPERKARAASERSRLDTGLARLKAESERLLGEVKDLDAYEKHSFSRPAWQDVKKQLETLRQLAGNRKAELDKSIALYQQRLDELDRYGR